MVPATEGRSRATPNLNLDIVTSPAPLPTRKRYEWSRPIAGVLVVGCVLAGVALRGFAFARNTPLWIDEAMLALNVLHRSPAELLQPLDMNQGAPVGYLLVSKLLVSQFGGGEFVLRVVSLAAAVVGMLLFSRLAFRGLPGPAAAIAVSLFALSPYLAGYAAEFKQYELDATIAVGLLGLGRRIWNGPVSRGWLVGLAVAGAAAIWFSHPAVFVLGGVGLAVLGDAAARRDRAGVAGRCLVVGAWLASFAAAYVLVLRNLGLNQYLLDYWAGKFLPLPPRAPGDFAWMVSQYFETFAKPGGLNGGEFGLAGLAGLCFLVGVFALAREDRRLLTAVAAPILLCLLASGLKKYPFAGRLLLFAVPLLLLGVARGMAVLAERLGEWRPGAGAVAIGVLFVGPVAECYELVKKPLHAEDVREALAVADAGWRHGDRLYVYYAAGPAFRYYQPRTTIPAAAALIGVENRGGDPLRFREELRTLRGGRVWVLLAHRQQTEEAAIRAYLDDMGTNEATVRLRDAVLFRYEIRSRRGRTNPKNPRGLRRRAGCNFRGAAAGPGTGVGSLEQRDPGGYGPPMVPESPRGLLIRRRAPGRAGGRE